MNTADILRGLWRRWYITIPGILLSVALAFMVWTNVSPSHQRTARQLLLPGTTSIPEGGNPYLYIGGLSQAADVVVLALGSNNVLDTMAEEHPGVSVEISRDTSTSSPVIVITVTAVDDAEGAAVLEKLVGQTAVILTDLQDQEAIATDNRISVHTVTVDGQSIVEQKDRMTATVGAGVVGVVLTLVLAASVDGLILSRRRRRSRSGKSRRSSDDTPPDVRRTRSAAPEASDEGRDEELDESPDREIRKVFAYQHVSVAARPQLPGMITADMNTAGRQDSD